MAAPSSATSSQSWRVIDSEPRRREEPARGRIRRRRHRQWVRRRQRRRAPCASRAERAPGRARRGSRRLCAHDPVEAVRIRSCGAGHVCSRGRRPLHAAVLAHVGTADRCQIVPIDRMFDVALPDGRRLKVPVGVSEMTEAYVQMFPESAKGLESFFAGRQPAYARTGSRHADDARPAQHGSGGRGLPRSTSTISGRRSARWRASTSWTTARARQHARRGPIRARCRRKVGFIAMSQVLMNGAEGTYYSMGGFPVADRRRSSPARRRTAGKSSPPTVRAVDQGGVTARSAGVVLDSGHEGEDVVRRLQRGCAAVRSSELVGRDELQANSFLRRVRAPHPRVTRRSSPSSATWTSVPARAGSSPTRPSSRPTGITRSKAV